MSEVKEAEKLIERLIALLKEANALVDELASKNTYLEIKPVIIASNTTAIESEDLAWHCVAHWLKCLYADFLHERIAGKPFPCGSCERRETCKSCPPVNFLPLIKKNWSKNQLQLHQ